MKPQEILEQLHHRLGRSRPPAPTVGTRLIPVQAWHERTRLARKPRGLALRALDKALESYERTGSGGALMEVRQTLEAWKRSEGGGTHWRHAARNRVERAFGDLDARLAGRALEADRDETFLGLRGADSFSGARLACAQSHAKLRNQHWRRFRKIATA